MGASDKKMLKEIEKALREQGWEIVERGRGKHPQARDPKGAGSPVTLFGTPSDKRSIPNLISVLRQRGFVWPWTSAAQREFEKEE